MTDSEIKELREKIAKLEARNEKLEQRLLEKSYEVHALRKEREKNLKFVRELMTEMAKEIDVKDVKIVE